MIRPRGGDFCYSDLEFETREDIRLLRRRGRRRRFGIPNPDGTIDTKRSKEPSSWPARMQVIFHRAFDMTPNAEEALETLIAMGVDRADERPEACDEGSPAQEVAPWARAHHRDAGGRHQQRNFAYVHDGRGKRVPRLRPRPGGVEDAVSAGAHLYGWITQAN